VVNRRAYLDLVRQFDDSHPTVSALAPLACFTITFVLLVLLRLVSSFAAVTGRCVDTDQFWYTSTGGNWPLIGSSVLVLFLLFAWNVLIGFDDWWHSRGTRITVVVNAIGIAALLYFLTAVHDSASFAHNSRAGLYDSINFRPSYFLYRRNKDECAAMQRFAGRWRVVDRKVGYYGFDVPAQWIELKPWGYAYAQDASWSQPYAIKWSPSYRWWYFDEYHRWHNGELFNAPWEFDLQGDTLTLSSPADWLEHEWQRSVVTLQREPIPVEPAYPNPHAATPLR